MSLNIDLKKKGAGIRFGKKEFYLGCKNKTKVANVNNRDVPETRSKGYERYADCFSEEFGELKNPIKHKMLNDRVYRF